MRLIRKFKELKSRFNSSVNLDMSFIYPYSVDKNKKRNEIWSNLQKGILLEDTETLISWQTPFNKLDNYIDKRFDKGDRAEWYFGKHKILDGYDSNISTMMWIYLPWTNPFERITEFIGFGIDGHSKSKQLKDHLTDLLGEPTNINMEFENETFFDGSYNWQNNDIEISINGFDMHGARYLLHIGLIRNKNEEYFKQSIEKMKAKGLTEEDLGK